ANHTEPFCHGCNRIRMDARGNIYGCLSDPTYYQIPDSSEGQFEEIDRALRNAMQTKKSQFTGSSLSMKFIGG
ncbi:MAG: molybdenum cofactor biosynthesis protein MoeA, partial [Leptospiraceae bacterium]|nr:molybdenum cofactor biosynthesis protein MoeA [Leptospiraceae bacterium]